MDNLWISFVESHLQNITAIIFSQLINYSYPQSLWISPYLIKNKRTWN
ncbi:hypothetical protein CLOAM0399 [Candidatus Cloacimonas acidaminovorans str. Evry]|uniref:Uncharacterized protein n=1 Tax=Cloacimonas acidaminovorans (strain Evry) TaxID=459349 RepID=B0VG79_CLOAI|nr:hypothetical protein CLOAM0399 [Candidatus Cloacimonas acidaminovorans str. Evry]